MDKASRQSNPLIGTTIEEVDSIYHDVISNVDSQMHPFDLRALDGMDWVHEIYDYLLLGEDDIKNIISLSVFFFKNYSARLLADHPSADLHSIAIECYTRLMDDFISRFVKNNGSSFYQIFHALIEWKGFVWRILGMAQEDNNKVSCGLTNMEWETYPLMTQIEEVLQQKFERFVEDSSDTPFLISSVIMYNVWGESFYSTTKNLIDYLPKTEQEFAMTNFRENKRFFFKSVTEELTKKVKDYRRYKSPLFGDLQIIFRDYIKRIYERINSVEVVRFATEYWREVSLSNIKILEDGESNRMRYDGIGEYNPFRYDEYYDSIDNVCKVYLSELEERAFLTDWSATIKSLGIDFDGLYDEMKSVFFTGVERKDLEYAFLSANFEIILKGAYNLGEKSGAVGSIKYMVKIIGQKAKREWYDMAAKSVTAEHNHMNAIRALEKGRFDSSKCKKLKVILYNNVKALRKG